MSKDSNPAVLADTSTRQPVGEEEWIYIPIQDRLDLSKPEDAELWRQIQLDERLEANRMDQGERFFREKFDQLWSRDRARGIEVPTIEQELTIWMTAARKLFKFMIDPAVTPRLSGELGTIAKVEGYCERIVRERMGIFDPATGKRTWTKHLPKAEGRIEAAIHEAAVRARTKARKQDCEKWERIITKDLTGTLNSEETETSESLPTSVYNLRKQELKKAGVKLTQDLLAAGATDRSSATRIPVSWTGRTVISKWKSGFSEGKETAEWKRRSDKLIRETLAMSNDWWVNFQRRYLGTQRS